MDGVIANWVAGYKKVTGGENPDDLNKRFPTEKERHEYKKTVVTDFHLYENLPLLSDAKQLIKYITDNFDDYQILTACGEYATQDVIKQKKKWLSKHFPQLKSDALFVIHSHQKALYANDDSILIDDRTKSINPFNSKGGHGVLHTSTSDTIKKIERILKMKNENETKLGNLLNEVLITFGGKSYPQFNNVVFLAGGAGSGKGFIKDKVLGIEGFVYDVDEIKKLAIKAPTLSKRLKDEYGIDVDQSNLLKNPKNVTALHLAIDDIGTVKGKIATLYKSIVLADNDRKPNIIFDITLKDITKLSNLTSQLEILGYEKKNTHLVWIVNAVSVAIQQNRSRDRVVPEEVLLATHKGASMTMAQIINMGDSVKKYIDGDIYFVFGKKDVDTVFKQPNKKSPIKNGYIQKASYIQIKPKGGSIDKSKITKAFMNKIKGYTPPLDNWDSTEHDTPDTTPRQRNRKSKGGRYGVHTFNRKK